MKTQLSNYAKYTRKQAFSAARGCLEMARHYKSQRDFVALNETISRVSFWRNEAAYYIRNPA